MPEEDSIPATRQLFNLESVRRDFPILSTQMGESALAYLDNAASAQKPKACLDAISRFYSRGYANSHRGVYALSQEATAAYEGARKTVADFLNSPGERQVVFTRGATESINLVANSFGQQYFRAGDNIALSVMEHHANIVPWQMARSCYGVDLRVAPMFDNGALDVEALERQLDSRTRLIAITHVSNALGTVNPVRHIIEVAKRREIPVLIDGAQAIAHYPVDVQKLDCDFYVFSGHKLFGPTGIGVLWAKESWLDTMPPYQGGGDMIARVSFEKTTFKDYPERFEAGTPNIAGAIGLAESIRYLSRFDRTSLEAHEQDLLDIATEGLSSIDRLEIHGTAPEKAAVLSFSVDGVHSHDIGTLLDNEGVAIRTGHHCCEPLMGRLGVPGTARASFAFYNTRDEAERLVSAVRKAVRFFL